MSISERIWMERPGEHSGIRDSLALAGVADVFLRELHTLGARPGGKLEVGYDRDPSEN
ncbi:hypothetical protein HYW94_04445 [Candidatus Uhrbacteria bacterium]|nr:hypothetical protein [Candidatus Uhrbacteria bacterium]